MAYETILLDIDDEGVATLTLDRPEVRNALNLQMVEELHDALGGLEARDDLRALVFTSTGGQAFMSGADVSELRDRRREDAKKGINGTLFARIERFPRPSAAAIAGWCLGGGMELVMACDFRVAGRSSRFGQPEVGLGIMAAAGGTRRLPALVGLSHARRLLYGGVLIDAEEALRIGLVDHVVEDDQVLDKVREVLSPILKQAPEAVKRTKQALLAWMHGTDWETLQALDNTIQEDLFDHPDKFARMDAFLEKRRARKQQRGG